MSARSVTVAFRISHEERIDIDEQAARCGLNISEFARRAVSLASRVDGSALAAAKAEGRAEMRSQMQQLGEQIAQAQMATRAAQQRAAVLAKLLNQSSDDLVAACKRVLAGDTVAKIMVATMWARLWRRERLKVLPIVAANLEYEFHQLLAELPIADTSIGSGIEFLQRLRWLVEALDVNSSEVSERSAKSPPEENPMARTLRGLAEALATRREMLDRQAATDAVAAVAPRETKPAWAEGLVFGYSQ